MHSDPIADMLTRVRNACRARKPRVDIPWSKVKVAMLEILKEEGFIEDHRVVRGKSEGQSIIEVKLRYDQANEPVIQDLQRVSRPGLRRYMHATNIPKVRAGQGVILLTTSKGMMTDRKAREMGVGGEALCTIW